MTTRSLPQILGTILVVVVVGFIVDRATIGFFGSSSAVVEAEAATARAEESDRISTLLLGRLEILKTETALQDSVHRAAITVAQNTIDGFRRDEREAGERADSIANILIADLPIGILPVFVAHLQQDSIQVSSLNGIIDGKNAQLAQKDSIIFGRDTLIAAFDTVLATSVKRGNNWQISSKAWEKAANSWTNRVSKALNFVLFLAVILK